jgi:hypothetical protein
MYMLHTIAGKILKSSHIWLSENLGCYSPPPLRESRPRDLGVTAVGGGLVSLSKVDGFYRHYTCM